MAQGWCQGAYARDENGKRVGRRNSKAVAWCPKGAVGVFAPLNRALRAKFIERIKEHLGLVYGSIEAWGDAPERTQAEVVAALQAVEAEMGLTRRAEQRVTHV